MEFIKRILLTFLILTAVGILFRGSIYRSVVTYGSIGTRANYSLTAPNLANYIESGAESLNDPDVKQIITLALLLTSEQLFYTADKNDIDPNDLLISKAAHCVGYATFFSTTCNYLLERYELSGNWIAIPQIGELFFLGINIHEYFSSPFFKDHDYVLIKNKKTSEVYAVDPTVNDYLKINFISHGK